MHKLFLVLVLTISLITIICLICFMYRSNKKSDKIDGSLVKDHVEAISLIHNEVTPHVGNGLHLLVKAFTKQGSEVSVLEIAKLYMHGIHPTTRSNKLVGGRICTWIMHDPRFSETIKAAANDLRTDEMHYEYGEIGTDTTPLPDDILDIIIKEFPDNLKAMPTLRPRMTLGPRTPDPVVQQGHILTPLGQPIIPQTPRNRQNQHNNDRPRFFDDFDLQTILQTEFPQIHLNFGGIIEDVEAPAGAGAIGDSQNVHSSSVQKAAKATLQAISFGTAGGGGIGGIGGTSTGSLHNFQNYLNSPACNLTPEQKDNVKLVIKSINSDVKHSHYDKSEEEIFDMVWTRINDPVNHQSFSDMALVFSQQLASAVEHKHVVCSTGKIVRMIGSLDGFDGAATQLRPEWAIDVEMQTLAAKIRTDVLNGLDDTQKEAYIEDKAPEIVLAMKEALRVRAKEDYSSLLSEATLKVKIDALSDAF